MKIFYTFLLITSLLFVTESLAQNLGFENNLSDWSTDGIGVWSINTTTLNVRSGLRSVRLITNSTSDTKLYNPNNTVVTPSAGNNYVTVICWVKGNNSDNLVAVGASDGISEFKGIEVNVSSSSFVRVEYTFPADNNVSYYPYLYGRSNAGILDTLYFDDVFIYTSQSSVTDITPPYPDTGIVATINGTQISLSWTPGNDESDGSGIDGVLILRRTGTREANQNVNNQTYYSATDTLVGPTIVNNWTVVYNGNSINSFTDDPGVYGVFTYLIYMRDKAYNYTNSSDAGRIFVFNGTGLTSSTTTNTRLDGLYLPEGCTFTSNPSSTVTIRTGANINVKGTIINQGNIISREGANVAFDNGSVYEYRKNGSVGSTMFSLLRATWLAGSTCKITGITTTFPGNLNQNFANLMWNCPSQSVTDTLSSSNLPAIISGDFTLNSTGSGRLILSNEVGSNAVQGNILINGGVVDAGNGATLVLNGTATQNITINGGNIEGNLSLYVDNPNGVILNSDLVVDGEINLVNGIIVTGTNTLTIGENGSVVRLNGHVSGNLRKYIPSGNSIVKFEIGDDAKYTPVEIEFNNVTSAGNITANTIPEEHPDILNSGLNPDKSVNRYYKLINDGVGFNSSNINFQFDTDDLDLEANPYHFIVKKYNSSEWSAPRTTGRTQTSVSASNITSFSDFAIGEGDIFTITASLNANGSIIPEGSVLVAEGTDQNFKIIPDIGYHLDSLIVDNLHVDSTTSYTFYYVTSNHSIFAYFSINKYTLNVISENGRVIKTPDQLLYDYGTTVELTAEPDEGYHFVNWSGDVPIGHETDNPITVIMDNNKSVEANFEINSYTIEATAATGGKITPSGLITLNYGDSQTFFIEPDENYEIEYVSVDGINQDSTTSYTFYNVNANHTIYVSFKEILNPIPTLTNITPASGYRGDTLNVLISGSNIFANAEINLDEGLILLNQNKIGDDMQATIVVSNYTSPGLRHFSITNPPPGGGKSNEINFIIRNYLPTTFNLTEPSNGEMIQLMSNPQPIQFTWYSANDLDLADTLRYMFHLYGTSLEDSLIMTGDTSIVLDCMMLLTPNTTYTWNVYVTDGYDTVASADLFSFTTSTTILSVDQNNNIVPKDYALYQNYPNPFNPQTLISYQLPFESKVSLRVYNLVGQLMDILADEIQIPGYKTAIWNAENVPSGVYFYVLEATNVTQPSRHFYNVRKMFLVR